MLKSKLSKHLDICAKVNITLCIAWVVQSEPLNMSLIELPDL